MAEPFSIAAGALGLGQQCASVIGRIYNFITSADVIDETLSDLVVHIRSLSAVFQTIGETLQISELINPHTPSHLENQYWQNVLQTMEDCTGTLDRLDRILAEVRGEVGQGASRRRSQIKFELRERGIDFCRRQIDGYCQTMQLSLQLLSLYYSLSDMAKIIRSSLWRVGSRVDTAFATEAPNGNIAASNCDAPNATGPQATSNRTPANAEMSSNIEALESLVNRLMCFVRSHRINSKSHEPNTENNNRVMINIERVAASARSIIFQNDDVEAQSQSEVESEEPEQDNLTSCPVETHTAATSIGGRLNLPGPEDPEADIELDIIKSLREIAASLLQENRYAEAKEHFLRVQIRSDGKLGNQYEWKDDTIMSIALINCRLRKWSEVKETLDTRFEGRDNVLQSLTMEYFMEGKLDEAVDILKKEEQFEGRDEIIRRIAEDLCRQKKWVEAVKFTQLKFIGREGSLEVVAAGFQQTGMWAEATSILKELLDLQIPRSLEYSVETMHTLANSYLHQKDFMNAEEWCKDTQLVRIKTVGRKHVLFYHTLNLRARIARQQGDLEQADSLRLLIPLNMREDCLKWDNVPEGKDVRDMMPWVNPEASILIGIEEDEFNKRLLAVGNEEYLGNTSTFQLLHVFAFQGSTLSFLTLLDNGVNIFSTTEFGVNVLHLAAAGGAKDIVEIALERGISIDSKVESGKGLSALLFAARMGYAEIVSLLLDKGSRVDIADKDGNSALSHAASHGHESVVRVLLENSAAVALKNSEGWTALHHASSNGHTEVVARLIDHGAIIDATDSDGLSSLFRAAMCGHSSTVRLLLQNGADPNLKTLGEEWTPLLAAVWMGQEEVVQVLVEVSKDVIDLEARAGSSGKTALMIAVEGKFEKIVGILISHRADIFATDISEYSPVSYSRRNSYSSQRISRMMANAERETMAGATAREGDGRSGQRARRWRRAFERHR